MHPWLNATNSHFQEPGKEKEKEIVSALKGLLGLSRQNLALTHLQTQRMHREGRRSGAEREVRWSEGQHSKGLLQNPETPPPPARDCAS